MAACGLAKTHSCPEQQEVLTLNSIALFGFVMSQCQNRKTLYLSPICIHLVWSKFTAGGDICSSVTAQLQV